MGKTARSQFYRTGIVLCDDYPVVRAHKSLYYWTLRCFGYLEMNKQLTSFNQLRARSSLPFRASTLVLKRGPKSEPHSAILLEERTLSEKCSLYFLKVLFTVVATNPHILRQRTQPDFMGVLLGRSLNPQKKKSVTDPLDQLNRMLF
jgi:hypothetical protein